MVASKPARIWVEPEPHPVPDDLLVAAGGSPLLARALWRRGLRTAPAARAFLDPDLYTPCPPADLPGLAETADRLQAAVRRGEPICVWGDFDVDGQTATAVLVSTLRDLGAAVSYHIPVRGPESHGVSLPVLEQVLSTGVKLVLTCDTGIAAHDAALLAAERGVDFLITDHHELPPDLPAAFSIVNPRLLPPGHPLASLPGVGVAYKLAEELYRRAGRPERAGDLLDLAALGIVADVAGLRGEARYLLQRGLAALRLARRPAVRAMLDFAGIDPLQLTEEHIGFALGPRLNALGRLGDANPVVEFFLSDDLTRVRTLAQRLEGLNAERQMQTQQIFKAALAALEAEPALLQGPVLVLAGPAWPAGIIGIVASRLVEAFGKPVVLLSTPPGEPGRGSARSVPGVDITAALAAVHALHPGLIPSFGGHPMAAGLSLAPGREAGLRPSGLPPASGWVGDLRPSGLSPASDRVEALRRALWLAVREQVGEALPPQELVIDGDLPLSAATLEFAEELERLAPFGAGNPALVLAARGLRLRRDVPVGRESEHRALTVEDDTGHTRSLIWWNGAGLPGPEGRFDLAYTLRATTYKGQRQAQLQWIDFRPVEEPAVVIQPPARRVVDCREAADPLSHLRRILQQGEALVWCEGESKAHLAAAGIAGRSLQDLSACETLVLWTAPPGRPELRLALEKADPGTVYIYGLDPGFSTPDAFLKRLAGLVKFALKRQSGHLSLAALASAAGQREITIHLGLDWLQAKGHIRWSLVGEPDLGEALVEPGPGRQVEDPRQIVSQLEVLLDETAAFRTYFREADVEDLRILIR